MKITYYYCNYWAVVHLLYFLDSQICQKAFFGFAHLRSFEHIRFLKKKSKEITEAYSFILSIGNTVFKLVNPAYRSKQLKSDNLQYNTTLAPWVDGTNDSSTKRLMFQALFFFIISYGLIGHSKLFIYFFVKL